MKKTIIVCGGSRGIGAALVNVLIKKNYRVICISRTSGEISGALETTKDLIWYPCDISNPIERKEVIKNLNAEPVFWGLVNNSGGPSAGPFIEASDEQYSQAFQAHFFAANDFVKLVAPK